jgi:hypothetical protein
VPPSPRGRRASIVLIVLIAVGAGFALTRRDADRPTVALADGAASPAVVVGTASDDPLDPSTAPNPGPCRPAASTEDGPRSVTLVPADDPPSSANVTADYRFRGSLASSVGTAPDLVETGRGSNGYAEEGLLGPPPGFRFARGVGLQLRPTTGVVDGDGYTIELVFRFRNLGGWRKIVDFSGGRRDAGLYSLDGCLNFFDTALAAALTIETDRYAHVVLTRDQGSVVVGYVDGVERFTFRDPRGLAEPGPTRTLRFFVDDSTTDSEDSSGAVSRIRLYDGPLSPSEVSRLACAGLPDVTCEVAEVG